MTHREIERAYAPAGEAELPDLTALPGVARVGDPDTAELSATYFDTAELALTRAGVSLRRRRGGSDEGWHLKLPAGRGRDEVQLPLTRAVRPPRQLVDVVVGRVRGAPLGAVASIETRRTTYPLLDDAGRVLAEVADDQVTGTPADGSPPVLWREWEVELVDGGPELLDAADELMAGVDVSPSAVQRKILRVLGDRVPAGPELPAPEPDGPAARVVQRRLAEQAAELLRRDSEIRRGRDEGIHKARVACRRLRSALATFRPLVDREVTDPLREEIKWLGMQLGGARDAKVVRERLTTLAREDEDAGEQVLRRLEAFYERRREAAGDVVARTLTSDRYLDLLEALERLVADPPWTDAAQEAAEDVLPRRVRKDWKRLRRRVEAVEGVEAPDERDAAVHEARKAAKRLRYAAETLQPAWGKDAKRLVKATKQVTTLLGERQDAVMSRSDLEQIATEAHAAGEDTFAYGRVHAREERRAAELDAEFTSVWADLTRPRLRKWLR
ncbi:MAG TPA: CYTH and CHAD domain-containing protein [Nocardioides sp.]|nr:CYTH and CHAD domain-containing protein [Nocardioides sp.]